MILVADGIYSSAICTTSAYYKGALFALMPQQLSKLMPTANLSLNLQSSLETNMFSFPTWVMEFMITLKNTI